MTSKNIGDGRLIRVCDVCGAVDDHPRHVIAGDPGTGPPDPDIAAKVLDADLPSDVRARVLGDLYDTTVRLRHLDCCREVGCPDGTCNTQTAGAGGKTGKAMLTHLMSLAEVPE